MLTPIANGQVGAVVTFLSMDAPPAPDGERDGSTTLPPLRLTRWAEPDAAAYRALFRRVGGRWLWYSRLAMADAELLAQLGEVYRVEDEAGGEAGLIELEPREEAHECRIRFLGLVPELAGRGYGRWLLGETLRLAWRPGVRRVSVHTCSLDHPAAMPAYLRAGFTARSRAFESFPDPRLSGLLAPDAAPQVPVVRA